MDPVSDGFVDKKHQHSECSRPSKYTVAEDFVFNITDDEFMRIRNYMYQESGIHLHQKKKQMMASRLAQRLRYFNVSSYSEYFRLVMDGKHEGEKQMMVDLLTTNETYFFREPAHFDFLRERICQYWKSGSPLRAWSAASSSGEEAYSMAMIFSEHLVPDSWELFGSDICHEALEKACIGCYSTNKIENIPDNYLNKYCLKGVRSQNGVMLVDRMLRERVKFIKVNLNASLSDQLGLFDVVFLRNVLIYFDFHARQQIVKRVLERMNKDAYLFVSHTETLHSISNQLRALVPSVYQKI